eukprot:CAMPEP_0197711938 /NCGR_PEP_ID=MMETSP1338-20131121/129709_1 /TAXON_ID=43686 ORGANISM="Pelagodinium beii, Strain RCC1491" /NCGR_SAMPLE_ID=MMETSP1338 /ASSEMBLY_ACC=CAM_ASM_000754 /LENGTH=77 /DNA_ID=CAMNT_0043295873 /DNA_START=104 /DNA_END=337 /DNA_ORIENTATION=+
MATEHSSASTCLSSVADFPMYLIIKLPNTTSGILQSATSPRTVLDLSLLCEGQARGHPVPSTVGNRKHLQNTSPDRC